MFRSIAKEKSGAYRPYSSAPTLFFTATSIPKIQNGFTKRFRKRMNIRLLINFRCMQAPNSTVNKVKQSS